MSDHHVSSENVHTSGQLKRKFSAMEEEEKESYEQQMSMAGRQKVELFGHYGQQSKHYIASEIAEKRHLKKNKKKLKDMIRIFRKKYVDIQKQINVMQDKLKEMGLI